MKTLRALIGFRELFGFTGIGMAFTGLWLVYPPSALIVVGAAMFGLALWGAR